MQQQIRIDNPATLDLPYIDEELNYGKHVIVQFSDMSYTDNILLELNNLCGKYGKSFGIRFYAQYYKLFDCQIIKKIPNVKCLYVDCLSTADNIISLTELDKLEKLSLGIYDLAETEILSSKNFKQLTELILGDTKTKALNLEHLNGYNNLKNIIICGHTKNISAVGNLANLESLSLNSVKKTSIEFINKLKNLKVLKLLLGGRENFLEIEENKIEHLEIVWVRGFNNISNISKFKKLRLLCIEDNIQLRKIDFNEQMTSLKSLKVSNCKTLDLITGLHNLISLERIGIYQTNVDFDSFIKQVLPTSLKALRFYTSKNKLNESIRQQIKQRGYSD